MNIFVTGGNGFLGSVVVRRLVRAGHNVRCLLRPTSDVKRIDDLPFERITGDVRDAAAVLQGVDGCDAVIHLANSSSWDLVDAPETKEITEQGTSNVLDMAGRVGKARVLYVSSAVAIGATCRPQALDETYPYRLANIRCLKHSHFKHAAEQLCMRAVDRGVDVSIVNPVEIYGPNDTGLVTAQNLIDFATSHPVFVCNGGTSVAHVDDVADGVYRAMERGRRGERYILGGENVTLRQLAELTVELSGQSTRIVMVPNWLIRVVTRVAQFGRIPLPFQPQVVPYATRYWFMDSSKARRELGVSFRSARETLEPTVAWLLKNGLILHEPRALGAAAQKTAAQKTAEVSSMRSL